MFPKFDVEYQKSLLSPPLGKGADDIKDIREQFQKGGPLSSVPVILAGGAAIMAIAGMIFFREPASWQRLF